MEWLLTQWHWAMILGAIVLLLVFGFVVINYDDDGSWWMF